jgi:uncharacterized phage protein (TIGR01671 family)
MRELKFRVWDKVNNKFISPFRFEHDDYYKTTGMVLLDFNGKIRIAEYPKGNGDNSASSVYSEIDNADNYVVQQYTGLTDKNKNLIYEGDIVKFSRLFEKERKIKELKSFVRFHNGQFGFDLIGFNDRFFTLSDECGIEVIGNIFEHSELLK